MESFSHKIITIVLARVYHIKISPALVRNRGELDEEKVPPMVPIPRLLGCGPRRPGYMPARLLILLELIGKVARPKPVTLN